MTTLSTVSVSMFLRCERDSCGAAHNFAAIVERFACHACLKAHTLGPEMWGALLDPAAHDLPRMKIGSEVTRDLEGESPGYVTAKREDALCASCSAPIAVDVIERGRATGNSTCEKCGAKLLLRPVPPALADRLAGVTHVLGEDVRLVANPDEPIVEVGAELTASCPSCGGRLPIDGKSQAVTCPYCRTMVVLPSSLWRQLRQGSAEPHVFYLVHDSAVRGASLRADIRWGSLWSVASDAEGNVYASGEDNDVRQGDKKVVFSLDPRGRTRWVRRDVSVDGDNILAARDGTVMLWSPLFRTASLLDGATGADAGEIGRKQPPNSTAHTLDLLDARSLSIDVDRTMIFVKEHRIVRCTPDGNAAPIWPAHKALFGLMTIASKTAPFTGESDEAPAVSDLGDYASALQEGDVHVGWDGSLYVWHYNDVASFDRTGKKRWVVKLPASASDVGADASGNAYALSGGGAIHRMAPDGGFDCIVEKNEDVPTGALVVQRDGTLIALGAYAHIVAMQSDGTVLWSRGEDDD